jgi:hypothetical protein
MTVPRQEGGINGKGGNNVNPLYRPFKAVGEAINRYMENGAEGYRRTVNAEKDFGRNSPQFKKAQNEYRGAAFQNRKPPKTK